jgi:hypothetical protein
MFLEHLKVRILKRRDAQCWSFARGVISTACLLFVCARFPTTGMDNHSISLFEARGCFNFVEKRFATTGSANNAETISELYLRGLRGLSGTSSPTFWLVSELLSFGVGIIESSHPSIARQLSVICLSRS